MYQGYMGMEMAPPKILLDLDSVTDIILLLDRHHATSFPSIDMRSKGSPEIFEELVRYSIYLNRCNILPTRILKTLRHPKTGFALLGAHQADTLPEKVGKRGLDTDMISPYEKTRRDRTCIRSLAG
ncbi:hypothetical protein T265_01566 [Opisthorchis viverrini]|uniref:Uncharacterized protein n=1 Tax=Opisthorchis viverrini TaxID=6198 RepID=A0A075AIW4_OPIVI|nr:hypothetical protein T265_01566 [Opisthorchis viverrini]KER32339.1 hypothetical protein T265_01566 [Opisthorchis viverrini]